MQTPQENLLFFIELIINIFSIQSTRLSAKSDDQELEYPQTLANRQNSTNVNDSTVQQSDQTGTSKDMARSYGKYEKLKDTPDNLYGMFVCILFVCKLSLFNSRTTLVLV